MRPSGFPSDLRLVGGQATCDVDRPRPDAAQPSMQDASTAGKAVWHEARPDDPPEDEEPRSAQAES